MTKRDNDAPSPKIPDVEIAGNTMLGDLKKLIVEELRAAPNVWQMMSEFQQEIALSRIDIRCRQAITKAMRIMAAGERPCVVAEIDGVTYKAGAIKATLKVSPNDANRHELSESAGAQVTIVLPGGADFMGGGEKVKPDAQQPELDGLGEPTGSTVNQATRLRDAERLCENIAEILDQLEATGMPSTAEEQMRDLQIDPEKLAAEFGIGVAELLIKIARLRTPMEERDGANPDLVNAVEEAMKGLPAPGTVVRAWKVAPKSGGMARTLPAAGMWATDADDAWTLYCAQHAGYHARDDFSIEEVDAKVFEQIGCLNPARVEPVDEAGAPAGADQAAPKPPPKGGKKPPRRKRDGK